MKNRQQPKIETEKPPNQPQSSGFQAPWWGKNRHLQTLWSALFRRLPPLPKMRRQRLELPDGDFIDLDISIAEQADSVPTLMLLHGLEGSIHSPYMRGMIASANARGWKIVVMHFRSCSGETNRLLKSYHSGVSNDLHQVLEILATQSIEIDFVVGYSLGGNVLLKWLGEQQQNAPIKAAVAVSVPLMLDVCANQMHRGFSRIYEWSLLRTLREKTRGKIRKFANPLLPPLEEVAKLTSFWQFDNQVTAPANGFKNAEDYYQRVSSRQFIAQIKIPTLIIQSKDDPFMTAEVLPESHEIPPQVTLEANQHGGHVGFVQGNWPWRASYYLESRIPNYLERFLNNG